MDLQKDGENFMEICLRVKKFLSVVIEYIIYNMPNESYKRWARPKREILNENGNLQIGF